jgi:hypothetical protein
MSFSLSAFPCGQVFALAGETSRGLHSRVVGDLTAAA